MLVSAFVAGALAFPLAVQATSHSSNNHRRHHAELAARTEEKLHESRNVTDSDLSKRGDCSGGRMTFYDITVGQTSCEGFYSANDFVVALNAAQYGTFWKSNYCGDTVTISYKGKTTQAKVVDECPGCPSCGLDMTEGLFSFFASKDEGVIYADWSFGSSGGNGGGNQDPKPDPKPTPQPPPKKPDPTTSSKKPDPPTSTHKEEPSPTSTEKKTSSTHASSTSAAPTTTSVPPSSSAAPTTASSSAPPTTSSAAAAASINLAGPGAALAVKPAGVVPVDASNPQTLNAINWVSYSLGSIVLQA